MIKHLDCRWSPDGPFIFLNLGRVHFEFYPCGWAKPRWTLKRWAARYHGGFHVGLMIG